MAMASEVRNALAVVAISVFVYRLITILWNGLWVPRRLGRIMAKQGVPGPPFSPPFGQVLEALSFVGSGVEEQLLNDFANLSPSVTPQYAKYFREYGTKSFVYWWGSNTRLVIRDPEIAKEVFVTNHASLKRSAFEDRFVQEVVGRGVLTLLGEKWTVERRTLNPFFHHDALKGMVGAMVEGAEVGIQKWEQLVRQGGGSAEIDVESDIQMMSGRILSITAFGGDFEKGEQIYRLQTEIAKTLMSSTHNPAYWFIPGFRKFPTKQHRYMNQCLAKVNSLLLEIINGRQEAVRRGLTSSYGNDLLGRMLSAASEGWDTNTNVFNFASVLNNCKLFYFAGQDTVMNAILFATLMLARHPDWQDRARKEVMEVFGSGDECNSNIVPRLKVMGMILNETLRVLSPVTFLSRVATKDIQAKNLLIPKGMTIELAIVAMNHDKDYWGDNVGEFNPERFANGVSGACTNPSAFAPFGVGPKNCIGNNFALMEGKIILARILRKFQILPSPNYKHRPTFMMVQRPQFGMPLILKAL